MSEPPWDRLPYDPQGFFQLPEDFTRKDLKRKYNEYLKAYKPEKFPAEFQRIRAAYEALDQRLRYGTDSFAGSPAPFAPVITTYEWEDGQPADPQGQRSAGGDPAPAKTRERKSWMQRLAEETPAQIAAELREIAQKRPVHYYVLACLEDSAPGAEPLLFLKWILRGLKAWPGDPGLSELLTTYLRCDVSIAQASQILRAVAKIVKGDEFFFLTEALWDRLLRSVPFEEFRRVLADCEAQLMDHRIAARIAFYMHILKPAIWLADDAWLEKAFGFLNEDGKELLWRFEFDLDLLHQLREYARQMRSRPADENPVRRQMHEVIRSFCLEEEPEFDRKFLACAVRHASDISSVFDAFPLVLADDTYGALYRIWLWLERDVAMRHGIDDDSANPADIVKPARALFRRIQEKSDRTRYGSIWTASGLLYLSIQALTFILALSLMFGVGYLLYPSAKVAGARVLQAHALLLAPAIAIMAGIAFSIRIVQPGWRRFCRYWARVCYVTIWRQELVPFLGQTRLDYGNFLEVLTAAEDESIHCSGWICHFCRADYALAFVTLGQRYIV